MKQVVDLVQFINLGGRSPAYCLGCSQLQNCDCYVYMSAYQATQITRIFDKTKHLIKECNLPLQPYKQMMDCQQQASLIISSLDEAIKHVISTRSIMDQYAKLEEIVQRLEAELRKHVGIQIQLKLYSQSIQQQLDESEAIRSEFLESTRVMLADLKRSNQQFAEENRMLLRKLSSDANTRTLRYSLTKGEIIRSSEEAISSKTKNKKFDLKQISSRRYLKTQQRDDSRSNIYNLHSSSNQKNLQVAEIRVSNPPKEEYQTQRLKKLRYGADNSKNQPLLHSSYHQLYESKNQGVREIYQYKKAPKRRSIKKSSLSVRADESQQVQTAPKNQ